MAGFFFNEEVATPSSIAAKRKLLEQLAPGNLSAAPVGHWTQALARVTGALADRYQEGKLNETEKGLIDEGTKRGAEGLLSTLEGAPAAPSIGAQPSSQPDMGTQLRSLSPNDPKSGLPIMASGQSGATPIERLSSLNGKSVSENAPIIADYLKTGGQNLNPQELAWCAAAVNSSLEQSGIKGTGSNMARSFLNFGETTPNPQKGDIAVFSRGNPNGPYGHVGFYNGDAPNGGVRVLGGNQGGGVNERVFPASQLLDIRRAPGLNPQNTQLAGPVPTPDSAPPPPEAVPMPVPRPRGLPGATDLPMQQAQAPTGSPLQLAGASPPSPAGAQLPPPQTPPQATPRQGPDPQKLMRILNDPWAPAPQKQVAQGLLLKILGKDPNADALQQEQLIKTRRENQFAAEDRPLTRQEQELKIQQGRLGVRKTERELEGEGAMPLSEAERKSYGIPLEQPAYKTRSGEIKFGPAGTKVTTNIDQKGETKFSEETGKALAKRFDELATAGDEAAQNMGILDEVRRLGGRIDTGAGAVITKKLGEFGIKLENAGPVEAYSALIDRLTPAQRIPGSGATSDFDAKMFKASLPGLMNTPEGNALILDTMEKINANKMARGDIAMRVQMGELKPNEGMSEIRKLQAEAKAMSERVREFSARKPAETKPASSAPAGAPKAGDTVKGYRFKGGDPSQQSNWEKL